MGLPPGCPIRENSAKQHSAGSAEPSAVEVRAELERILASRCFEQAGRSSSFLRFVVEQTLAGQGERLKGYTIAIEVFGRPPDFDAQTDPLVRVEAGRLRRRLIEYYAGEGRDDPVRLDLPRGSYSVVSTYTQPPLAETVENGAPPAETPVEHTAAVRDRSRWRRIRTVAFVGAVIAVGFREVLSSYTDNWLVFLGALYVVSVMFFPQGLMRLRRRRAARDQPAGLMPVEARR